MKPITPCLWFDGQAEEAARFYATVFSNTRIGKIARYGNAGAEVSGQKAGSVMTIEFQIEDLPFLGLNGGPEFKFSPALSFFVSCSSEEEIHSLWKKLADQARMELGKYPWAELYGWTTDRFGVDWQLMLNPQPQKIVPAFLFVDGLFGKGEEAINFYTSVFPNSKIESLTRDETTKTVMHASLTLNGQMFMLMDGAGEHGFKFTHATSLIVYCTTQSEVDHYHEKLSRGGSIEPCGWVKDKYGVSWQEVPEVLSDLMANPEKSEAVMKAMLGMKKLDFAALARAGQ